MKFTCQPFLCVGAGLWLAAMLAVGVLTGCASPAAGTVDSPQTARRAGHVAKSMGGQRALGRLKYLRFDFEEQKGVGHPPVRRSHLWDRTTGAYRLDSFTPQGQAFTAFFNVHTGQGDARRVGRYGQPKPPHDPALLALAMQQYRHDTFWLLGAFQMRQEGAGLSDAGEWNVLGQTCPTLLMTFPSGASPIGYEKIWFHISPQTGRPLASSVAPAKQTAPVQTFYWKDWQLVQGLNLPTCFEAADGSLTLRIQQLFSPDGVNQAPVEP